MMLSKKNSEALENFSEKLEVEGRSLWQDARRRFMHNRAAVTSLIMLVLIALFVTFAPMVSSFSYFDTDWGMMSNAPDMASGHYFGTDSSGRDLLVRVAIGGRISLMVGVAAALVAVILGTLYGSLSGYLGGKVDSVMMRLLEILNSFPFMFFVILLVTFFGQNILLIFVAIGMVSNVLGLRAPVEEIVARAHAVGAVVVLDCAQSAPHMPVDVKKLDVDFAACSAHKLYAPMGMGALYARKELLDKMPPFLSGGDMIGAVHEHTATWAEGPRKFEAGTRNVGGEVGFAAALDYMDAIGWDAMMAHEHALLERMLKGMASMPWLTVYGEPLADKRFGVVSFNVQDVHPHDVATILDAGGVAIRAGHHCAQPLMDFLGIGSCCRASLALYNTEEDVDALLNNLENVRKAMGL